MTVLDYQGNPIDSYGEHDAQTAALKIALSELCVGQPAAAIALACIEYVIHVAQQSNGNPGFRKVVAELFDEAARVMRRHP